MALTREELLAAIEKAGATVDTMGRYRLAAITGIGEATARRFLLEERGKLQRKTADPVVRRAEQIEQRDLRKQLQQTVDERVKNERYETFVAEIASRKVVPPKWLQRLRKARAGSHHATPVAFFSDAHFDEVVDAAQVNGVNAYDREIAGERLELFFRNTVELARDYLKGLDYDGIVLPMGGDIFTGNIHDELKQTNEGTMMEAVLHWLGPVEAGIKLLAEEFGAVYVPVVVGNHPRNTVKPIYKGRVRDNFDWLFARLMERDLADDKRITFAISEAPDCDFQIYGYRFTLTHGDQFKGGSGIAGLLSPMMIGDARKRKRAQAIRRPYDYLLMGHWHQMFVNVKGVVVNGSLKGYDEYAFNNNFEFEPPRQAFFLVDPDRGITITAPIHVTTTPKGGPQGRD